MNHLTNRHSQLNSQSRSIYKSAEHWTCKYLQLWTWGNHLSLTGICSLLHVKWFQLKCDWQLSLWCLIIQYLTDTQASPIVLRVQTHAVVVKYLSTNTWKNYLSSFFVVSILYFLYYIFSFVDFTPLFSPISWYPIVTSYYLVSSLQLPHGLRRDEGHVSSETQPSCTAS